MSRRWSHFASRTRGNDITDDKYRQERQPWERRRRELKTETSEPVVLNDITQAGKLLDEFGTQWSHPGVTAETKKAFIEEAFEQIEIDEVGVRTVRFAEPFLPAVAIGEVGGNGAGEGIRTLDILLGRQALYH